MTQCGVDLPRLRDVWSFELLAHPVLWRVQSWQTRLESLRAELSAPFVCTFASTRRVPTPQSCCNARAGKAAKRDGAGRKRKDKGSARE